MALKSLGVFAGVLSPVMVILSCVYPQLPAQSYPEWRQVSPRASEAQRTSKNPSTLNQFQVSLQFPPTQARGAPARTVGGGTRGSACTRGSKITLKALTPSNNVGTTVAANPTLYWYIPQTTAKAAEFVLLDNKNNEVYTTNVALVGTPGVVKLSLPAKVSLQVGKNYMWQFALICDRVDRSQDLFVRGLIQRVELSPELKSKLRQVPPLEQAKIYASAKVWQETLTTLAALRSSAPREWEELLKSVGLQDIAREPFVSTRLQDIGR